MSIQYVRNTVQETEGSADVTEVNAELAKIEAAFQKALSREQAQNHPNQMVVALDMNSNPIINLPYAQSQSSPITLGQLNSLLTNVVTTDLGPFVVPDITGATPEEALENLLVALDAIGLIVNLTTFSQDATDSLFDSSSTYIPTINAVVPENSRREAIYVVNSSLGSVTLSVDPGYLPGDRLIVIDATHSWDENPLTVDFINSGYAYYGEADINFTGSLAGNRAVFTYINPLIGFIGA